MKHCKNCKKKLRNENVTMLCRDCLNKEKAEKYYAIKNCKVCNEEFEVFRTRDINDKILCSRKCLSNWLKSEESQNKTKKTNLERYGVEFVLQSETIRENGKETKLKKYGDKNYTNTEKAKQTCLDKYGVEHGLQSKEIQNKLKQTCLDKYGVESVFQSKEIREKGKETSLELYGFESPIQNENIKQKVKNTKKEIYGDKNYNNREKGKETCLKKYGVYNVSQIEKIKIQKEETLFRNYGVINYSQTDGFGDKIKAIKLEKHGDENYVNNQQAKETCLKIYGVENPMHVENIKEKRKETCLLNLGVEYPMQSIDVQNKSKQSNLKNHGYEYPAQNPKIHEKQQKSALKIHFYKNSELYYRGKYELFFLELMDERGLLKKVSKGKSFKYVWNNELKIYHSDFHCNNKTIEIKSTWTYNKNGKDLELEIKNETKWQAVRNTGEQIIILIEKQQIKDFVNSLLIN